MRADPVPNRRRSGSKAHSACVVSWSASVTSSASLPSIPANLCGSNSSPDRWPGTGDSTTNGWMRAGFQICPANVGALVGSTLDQALVRAVARGSGTRRGRAGPGGFTGRRRSAWAAVPGRRPACRPPAGRHRDRRTALARLPDPGRARHHPPPASGRERPGPGRTPRR